MRTWKSLLTLEGFVDLQLLFALRLFEVLQLIPKSVCHEVRPRCFVTPRCSIERTARLVESTAGSHEE